MIRSIGAREEDLSIVSGFDRSLYDAFKNAVERGQTKALEQLIYFIQRQLISAFGKDSAVTMQQLNWLPSAIYNLSVGNAEAAEKVVKEFGSFFKTVSWLFTSEHESNDPIGEHPVRFHMFFKILMNFYHYAIHHPDETLVRELINKFKSIAGDEYDFDTRFEIRGLDEASQQDKKKLRDAETKKHLLMITQRRATLALVAWLVFLFINEKLSEERLVFLLQQFGLRYDFFEEMLDDIDYIRSNERADYFGIDGWDYLERESGVMYSPPSAYDWILFGPALLLLRDPLPHFNAAVIIDDRQHAFLLEAMKQKLQVFKLRLDKFLPIIGWNNNEQLQSFNDREAQILEMFQTIKTLNEEEENRELAERPLDKQLIQPFLEKLYEKWLSNCQSYQLFKEHRNIETVDTIEGLDYHGQSVLLEHQRTMFAQGEQQTIYGSEDLGSIVGRGVDERFIYNITKLAPLQRSGNDQDFDSVSQGLDVCITALRLSDVEPDMIIVPSTYFYKTDLTNSGKYKRINMTDKSLQIGIYDGIPVLRMFAQGLNAKAIVTSFDKALSLTLYQDQSLYKGLMHLDLRELDQNEIIEELEKESAKWKISSDGVNLTDHQARLRLAASLMLEMWTRGKFNVTNLNAITWCRFNANALAK